MSQSHPTSQQEKERRMAVTKEQKKHEIDLEAPAGSPNSLGAESVRDGRPSTDSSVVEAMDEEGPGIEPVEDIQTDGRK
jgi:hypothetical protein